MLKLFQLLNRITYLRVCHKIDAKEHSRPEVGGMERNQYLWVGNIDKVLNYTKLHTKISCVPCNIFKLWSFPFLILVVLHLNIGSGQAAVIVMRQDKCHTHLSVTHTLATVLSLTQKLNI